VDDKQTVTAGELRAVFDALEGGTVGLEEEALLLDPATLEPVARAEEVVARAGGDPRIKLELPAAQVEVLTRPHARIEDAVAELAAGRAALAAAADGIAVPAAAAVHPTAPAEAQLHSEGRYAGIEDRYGIVVRRQLVGALQVHVAVGGADRTLAVYNALRGHLPELAALSAAAPFHEGRDTGLASIRPLIGGQLPRQGVPPVIDSWEAFADDLRWGAASGHVVPRNWWWELRPHLSHGTLELRVPDVQPTIAGAAAVAELCHALVLALAARFAAGETLPAPATWRIAENRFSALRFGVDGTLLDLDTGEPAPTREVVGALIDGVQRATGRDLGAARALLERPAYAELRAVGLQRAAAWLRDAYLG
jgi:carboxylate-amine ligase